MDLSIYQLNERFIFIGTGYKFKKNSRKHIALQARCTHVRRFRGKRRGLVIVRVNKERVNAALDI